MSDIYPLVVVLDRYNGTYSGGKWTAWNLSYVPWKIDADDTECADFFAKNMIVYGRGETPQEAIDDLKIVLDCGIPDPDEEDEEEEKEEDEKMEPTSVWRIENIDNIWMSQDVDGMSLMLKNKDDLTQIVMTGDAIDNFNDKFVISPQADMLDKEAADYWSKEYDILLKRFKKLQEENEHYKEAAERRFNEKLHDFEVNNKKYDGAIMEEILKRNYGRYPLDEGKSSTDNVNHPSHYTGKYECIDVMQDVFGDDATNDFCLCNAFKYIWRAHKKNGLEDVKKAVWYLNKYIEEAEKDGKDEVTRTRD